MQGTKKSGEYEPELPGRAWIDNRCLTNRMRRLKVLSRHHTIRIPKLRYRNVPDSLYYRPCIPGRVRGISIRLRASPGSPAAGRVPARVEQCRPDQPIEAQAERQRDSRAAEGTATGVERAIQKVARSGCPLDHYGSGAEGVHGPVERRGAGRVY